MNAEPSGKRPDPPTMAGTGSVSDSIGCTFRPNRTARPDAPTPIACLAPSVDMRQSRCRWAVSLVATNLPRGALRTTPSTSTRVACLPPRLLGKSTDGHESVGPGRLPVLSPNLPVNDVYRGQEDKPLRPLYRFGPASGVGCESREYRTKQQDRVVKQGASLEPGWNNAKLNRSFCSAEI